MLNELLSLERALRDASIETEPRHPDIHTPRRADALHVRLDADGAVADVALLSAATVAASWTLGNGNHNRFPYVQIKKPVAAPLAEQQNGQTHAPSGRPERRRKLREAAGSLNANLVQDWPGEGYKEKVRDRLASLKSLEGSSAAAVPAAVARFLIACGNAAVFFHDLAECVLAQVEDGGDDWLAAAETMLFKGSALYFDVAVGEFRQDAVAPANAVLVSQALNGNGGDVSADGRCALTGLAAQLLSGPFPRPSLRGLGPTYLFSRNKDTPAASRYGRSALDTFPVGQQIAQRLGSAATEVVAEARHGRTWRMIPAERKGDLDLLIAYAVASLEVPLADALGGEQDTAAPTEEADAAVDPIAAFEKRTGEVLEAVKGRVAASEANNLVQIIVLRKVDPGNHKVVLHRPVSAEALHHAARRWAEGERNTPEWLRLPVPRKDRSVRQLRPPHLAPLQVPGLTRTSYLRGGTQAAEVIGLPAGEALALLLDDDPSGRHARRVLTRVLKLQGILASGSAHGLRKGMDHAAPFDRMAALRTLGFIGLLLRKAGRRREDYMQDTAFRLGQLLASADALHAGYCADQRGGAVPPTLLGNAVFAMAQSNPARALGVLCRRWKPYGAWAQQPKARAEADRLVASGKQADQNRGWAIRRGVSQAHRAADLARALHGCLPPATDDLFRAELLLGYVAGLEPQPKPEPNKAGGTGDDGDTGEEGREEQDRGT